jgi:hypothetical protein
MTNQSNEAAERSAHVTRGDKPTPAEWPVIQLADGTWKLRIVVELEEERDLWKQRYEDLAYRVEDRFDDL